MTDILSDGRTQAEIDFDNAERERRSASKASQKTRAAQGYVAQFIVDNVGRFDGGEKMVLQTPADKYQVMAIAVHFERVASAGLENTFSRMGIGVGLSAREFAVIRNQVQIMACNIDASLA